MSSQPTPPSNLLPHADKSTHHHRASTSSHPPTGNPDPTLTSSNGAERELPTATSSSSAELTRLTIDLRKSLRQFPDFPSPGILFEDILPIFADPSLHEALLRALELHVQQTYVASQKPDVVVGLDARGFLFGPSLALRLGAAFVPVRKQGKLPGPTNTASFKKEYGEDFFQIQADSIKPGQRVLVVDDIIATGTLMFCLRNAVYHTELNIGGSAAAAGSLVQQLGGTLIAYIFILELDFLKGKMRSRLPISEL
jgi:adenine phosphoribosyltransferase